MRPLVLSESNVLVNHLEVVPLRVTLRVQVVLKPEIVLDVAHLCSFAEVAVLEPRVKDQDVLHLGHRQASLEVREVSLRLKPRQISVEELVLLGLEVALLHFLSQHVLEHFLLLVAGEQDVRAHSLRLASTVVLLDLLVASELAIGVVDQSATHLNFGLGLSIIHLVSQLDLAGQNDI